MKFSLFNFDTTRGAPDTTRAAAVMGSMLRPPMPAVRPEFAQVTREFQELNRKMIRAYDAAITTNFNADFKSTYGAANTEIFSSKFQARGRARTLAKDTPHGKAIIRTFQNDVVGDDPFRLDMRIGSWVKDEATGQQKFVEECETNRMIEEAWERFGWPENFTVRKNMSRMEAFRIMEGSAVRDGSILLRHHRFFPHNEFGYAVELLEEDRLQESFMGKSPSNGKFGAGNPIRFSIERDPKYQFPLAYWILTRHPQEFFGFSGPSTQVWREQVPAADIIHFNNLRDRAEQDIGFTELDATVQSLWRNWQYDKALTFAAVASCCKPFWIKKTIPTGMQFTADQFEQMVALMAGAPGSTAPAGPTDGSAGVAGKQQGIAQRASTETPASTIEMEFGQELMQVDPKFPIEAAHEFRGDNLRDIAVGSGMSYQDISGDFQNLGFAAALMCQRPKQDYCKVRQNHFKDSAVRLVFREWLKSSILNGVLDLDIARMEEYVAAARFKGKRWAFVNPLVEAQTLIIMLEAGIMAPQQVQDRLPDGVSIEDLYTMIAEAKDEQEKHGLDFRGADATRPGPDGGEPDEEPPTGDGNGNGKPTKPKRKVGNPVRSLRTATMTRDLMLMQGDGRNGAH